MLRIPIKNHLIKMNVILFLQYDGAHERIVQKLKKTKEKNYSP